MKRILCLLLVLLMMCSLCVQAFADGDVLYCRMCGKQIPTDSRVCLYCGEKVVYVTDTASMSAPADNKTNSSLLADIAAAIPPLPAPSAAPEEQATTAPAVTAPAAVPTPATDVNTALSQSSAPSPATQAAAAVPGPFNTVSGTSTFSSRVRVTKSPTSESVPYGGSCMFIAHAANATSVTWYIANNDASIICAASDAPYSVSGLYVSGANSDTLYLSGIPSWWNGVQVQACFTGEGGPVYTEAARIWTYQPAVQPCRSNWGFWDWFNYYCWDDPYTYNYPWWYWFDLWEDEPNPPDVGHAITVPGGGPSIAPEMPGPGFIYDGQEAVVVGHTHTKNDPTPPPPPPPTGDSSSGGPGPAPAGFNPGGSD